MLIEYLKKTYGTDNPILLNELQFEDYSESWLYAEVRRLCNTAELLKFDKGVYYLPSDTGYGKSILLPEKVIERKYVSDGDNVYGFYGGIGFMNRIGLSTQVVSCDTIYTNREASRRRKIQVGYLDVILRKPRVEVTKENANVLAFLEMMTEIPDWFFEESWRKEAVDEYIRDARITREDILRHIHFYPDKTSRKLLESEVIFRVA